MNQAEYDTKFNYNRCENQSWLKRKIKTFGAVFTPQGFSKSLRRRLPIIGWVSNYHREYFLTDIIAGITVGIYNVPQAMSYATLAGLPPVYGLYASFFPPLLYTIFGTANHTSIGVFSITCMMINKVVQKMIHFNKDGDGLFKDLNEVNIATSLCLLTGLFQSLMAIIRCDKFMKFLSSPAISAITFSFSFFGIFSQMPKMLGIKVPDRNERWFSLVYLIYDIFENIGHTNITTLIISISVLTFLMVMKLVIEPRLRKTSFGKIPFPSELVTIVATTLLSYYLQFEKNYGVKTINHVPRGFPEPSAPRVDIWPYIIMDSLSIAIVAYAVTISMGQIFSKKHKYRVDSNQELLALGVINVAASFFSTFPTSASMSRTILNEECGTKTQFSGIISSMCILIVITFIGPLLESLPSCVLAVIVTVAVRSLLMNYRDLPKLWKYSKHDFYIWIITAVMTLSADIAEGVAAGIIAAIFTIAIQSQQPTIKQLGQVRVNDFKPLNHYDSAKETSYCIIRFDAPLIFANVDKFLSNVRDTAAGITRTHDEKNPEKEEWTALIIDCHTWTYTDSMGLDAIKEIDEDLKAVKIMPLFANLKSSLRRQFLHSGIMDRLLFSQFFPSIQDALDSAPEIVSQQNVTIKTSYY